MSFCLFSFVLFSYKSWLIGDGLLVCIFLVGSYLSSFEVVFIFNIAKLEGP